MKSLTLCLLLVLTLIAITCCAQPPDTLWTQTYGGINSDESYGGQITDDNGYILVGGTNSYGAGSQDVYLVKTNSSGDTMWTGTYGGGQSDWGWSVRQTHDGGYIIAGGTNSFGSGSNDIYLIKTDASGDTMWTRTIGGSGSDYAWCVRQTLDGGYIIVGQTSSYGAGGSDVYLVKTNASGDLVWDQTWGGNIGDWGYFVQQTSDGGYIIAGETLSFGTAGHTDIYLIKTDDAGDTTWTRTIGGTSNEIGWCVQQIPGGGYIIVGETSSFGAGNHDMYLVKTNVNGNVSWTQTFGGSEDDYGYWVEQMEDGGYVLAGITDSFGAGEDDFYLVRTDAYGNEIWTQTVGGIETENAFSIQPTQDGGYFVQGYTYSYGAGASDVYLVRLESDPNPVEPPQGFGKELPTDYCLSPACPNPFNPTTTFKVELPVASWVTLEVFDLSGRSLGFIIDGWRSAGYHEVIFDASGLASGVYVYQMKAGDFNACGKMVLMK